MARSSGSIIVTGNTAALRGVPNYGLFAPSKAAHSAFWPSPWPASWDRRACIVAYVTIDAAPSTRPGPACPSTPTSRKASLPNPTPLPRRSFHVAHQDPSTWSFDVELRPFGETW